MEIIQEQSLEINNLVSLTGRTTASEFQKSLVDMINTYKDFSIANGDYLITSTRSVELVDGEQVMDMEILIPVSYRMPVDQPYTFKNKLKLVNTLYVKLTDIAKLQDTLNEVNQYVLDQKLQPITPAYLVQTKQENKLCIEIYLGINPNIL